MSAPTGSQQPGRGRGRPGRGGGSRGGPGRGRGGGRRGQFGGSLTVSAGNQSNAPETSSTMVAEKEKETEPTASEGAETSTAAEEGAPALPEVDLCFICAEPVKLYSVASCNHRTCHICAIRLRALYKKTECTFCKTPIERLIFTPSPDKLFEEFRPTDIPFSDPKLSISFETREAMEETLILLRFNCPDPRCEVASAGWADLKMHARRDHGRLICDLCIKHKKIFAHEHTLHTSQSLAAHMSNDHRLCEYCRENFYSDDELFIHMRDRHEQCHICKARGGEAERWKYFRDYTMLERHFRDAHYLCTMPECLDKKFIVFESEIDFKAHQVSEHGGDLSNRDRRDALRVETHFSYDEPGDSRRGGRGGRRGGRGGGRGGDREAQGSSNERLDPLGVSSLASRTNVPGAGGPANHQSRRAQFGGSLTAASGGASAEASSSRATGAGPSSSADAATAERHAAYLQRVTAILKGSDSKVASFRSAVRTYRASEMSAKDLVHTIHSIVGHLDESAVVVNGLVDLLEEEEKRTDVLSAWNGFRIERTQFPSLVPMTNSNSQYAGIASNQVRNVKNTKSSGNQVWDNVERAASASSGHGAGRPSAIREHFPALRPGAGPSNSASVPGSAAHSSANRAAAFRAAHGHTPWSTSSRPSTGPASAPSPAPRPQPVSINTAASRVAAGTSSNRSVPKPTESAFPSLPSNASQAALLAHKRAVLSKNNSSNTGGGGASANGGGSAGSGSGSGSNSPWASGSVGRIDGLGSTTPDGTRSPSNREEDPFPPVSGGKGKKKKGKQVILSFGGVPT